MRATRYTCWTLITLLLLHGGGVLSTLHKLAHHASPTPMRLCDHDASVPAPDDHRRTPMPADDHHCSVCSGLGGLHLIGAPARSGIITAPVFGQPLPEPRPARPTPAPLRPCPARAPPIR